MSYESGSISINTENIFPIIKKWLYSEKDIFIRELVSNAGDAISKLKKLSSIGEAEMEGETKYLIKVIVDKDDETIKIIDNGIGMTDEEIKKYINQIAFSGARDFLEKYKDKADESQIIGHFGLGFYSSFMVSEKVEIDTMSYQKGSKAVKWSSTGGIEFELGDSDRLERGTTVTLHLAEDSLEFLEESKVREVLTKYFSFLPIEIYLECKDSTVIEAVDVDNKESKEDIATEAGDESYSAESLDDAKEAREVEPINDIHPLWLKSPKDCTDEEYKSFYKKVFHDFNDPLFWIHLNMDYPFNLKGILFFPKLKHEYETIEGQIKLYYNQVFVADNIKEVIPDFLMLLKGTLDCPDLPLNVSRSFLQNDGYVNKISTHITKKVADKLASIFENSREDYAKYWSDINPFVKYGCIREQKFFDKVKDIIIFKTSNDDHVTLKEYLERNKEKHENKVFYVTDEKQQAQYIRMFKDNGMEAIILSNMLDSHFVQFLESKEYTVKFARIDSDLSESLKESDSSTDESVNKDQIDNLTAMFKEFLGDDKLKIQVESLKSPNIPSMILLSEQSRRMQEMSRMYGGMDMSGMFPSDRTLVINKNNKLIQSLLEIKDNTDRKDDLRVICEQVYDLAMLGHKQLEPDAMMRFVERSNAILARLAEVGNTNI